MGHVLAGSGAILMSAFALFSITLWIRVLVFNVRRLQAQTLRPIHVVRVEEGGLTATFATILAVLLLGNVLVDDTWLALALLDGLLIGVAVLITLWLILWGLTFWLWLQAQRPAYLYLLPRDAEHVRRQHARFGMQLLASMYPLAFNDPNVLDTFTRALQVRSRLEMAPRWKRERWELTNDFAVYCNVASEGYQRGYLGLLHACAEASDQLETVRATLQAWPDTPESQQAMEHWVTQMMGPEPQANDAEGAV